MLVDRAHLEHQPRARLAVGLRRLHHPELPGDILRRDLPPVGVVHRAVVGDVDLVAGLDRCLMPNNRHSVSDLRRAVAFQRSRRGVVERVGGDGHRWTGIGQRPDLLQRQRASHVPKIQRTT